jgi:hypothetical protein
MKIGCFLSSEEWGRGTWPAADERTALEPVMRLWPSEALPGELYVNQIGPDQDACFEAYSRHVLPALR